MAQLFAQHSVLFPAVHRPVGDPLQIYADRFSGHYEVRRVLASGRLHYVHISAPDRGAVHDSWIPWKPFLGSILERYNGPFLIEIFNAIPVFLNSLRLTRKKFWIPEEDVPNPALPDAYTIACEAIAAVRREIREIGSSQV